MRAVTSRLSHINRTNFSVVSSIASLQTPPSSSAVGPRSQGAAFESAVHQYLSQPGGFEAGLLPNRLANSRLSTQKPTVSKDSSVHAPVIRNAAVNTPPDMRASMTANLPVQASVSENSSCRDYPARAAATNDSAARRRRCREP
jgi:hypothetical protein